MREVAKGYSNLEFDLETGKRGDRGEEAESSICRLTGAQAAMIVNNNAAAVLLVLSALAWKKRVVIARSQLVEIGGGFRMPDVMRQSGAKLLEVGTTNRVRLTDYQEALHEAVLVMRAHRSNFKIIGFTEEPEFRLVVAAAHAAGLIVVDDLGFGGVAGYRALRDRARAHCPRVAGSRRGSCLLLWRQASRRTAGGHHCWKSGFDRKAPQASAGACHPADKMALAGVAATLQHYLRDEAQTGNSGVEDDLHDRRSRYRTGPRNG